MMWVEDQPFPFATGSVTYSFRVYFLSQVPTLKNTDPETLEQTNVVEAKSDMLQCAQDLMSFWVQDHNYPDLDILKSTLGTPFHDTLMDSLTGFYIDIKLEQGFKYDSCSIPMTGITPPPTPGCDDVLVSFNGTSVTSTPSGNTKAVVVQSDAVGNPQVGTVVTDTATQLTIEVPAGGSASIDIDINGTPYVAGVSTNQDIPVVDTASNPIGTIDPGVNVEVADVTQTLNGNPITNNKAETSKAIIIEYANGDPVTVTSTTDTETNFAGTVPNIPAAALNTSNLRKTFLLASLRTGDDGATQRGRGVSWYKTDYNNLWGHAFRFCGTNGGYTDGVSYFDVSGVATTRALAFPNNEMSDWAYWDQINGKVMMWYLLPFGTTTPVPALPNGGTVGGKSVNNAIDEALASTQNGRSDWYCPNIEELNSIIYREQAINAGDALNYPPFDYAYNGSFPSSTGWRIVSSSSKGVRAMYLIITNGITAPISLTNTLYSYFIIREADITTDFGL